MFLGSSHWFPATGSFLFPICVGLPKSVERSKGDRRFPTKQSARCMHVYSQPLRRYKLAAVLPKSTTSRDLTYLSRPSSCLTRLLCCPLAPHLKLRGCDVVNQPALFITSITPMVSAFGLPTSQKEATEHCESQLYELLEKRK